MAQYEIAVLYHPDLEVDLTKAEERVTKIFTDAGAKVTATDNWGKRKLAYPINYENDGYYIVIDFTSDEAFPQELDRVINITDGVLRSLIVAKGE